VQVHDAGALGPALVDLLTDEPRRRTIGEAAARLVDKHRGAVDRTVDALAALIA
jgi:hypothetical protein